MIQQKLARSILREVVDDKKAVDAKAFVVLEEVREQVGLVAHGHATENLVLRDRDLAIVDSLEAVVAERGLEALRCLEESSDAFVQQLHVCTMLEAPFISRERLIDPSAEPQLIAAI